MKPFCISEILKMLTRNFFLECNKKTSFFQKDDHLKIDYKKRL